MPMLAQHSTPSKFLECKFSSKSGEVLNLGPSCLKIDFRYKIMKYQCQTRTQRLYIDWSGNVQVNLTRF